MLSRLLLTASFSLLALIGTAGAQSTTRVSTSASGAQSNDLSQQVCVSRDGALVVFSSRATNLVPGDTNGLPDLFAKEVATGAISRLNLGPGGVQAVGGQTGFSTELEQPSISADRRYVAFVSLATNLVANDTNGVCDVFVRDRQANACILVSSNAVGAHGNGTSQQPCISANGRYVSFRSSATNLLPGDTNGVDDVFVKDLSTGAIERVSVSSAEIQADQESWGSSLSADGQIVVFDSIASNLVAGDTNDWVDVFVRDRQAGTTTRIDVFPSGAQAAAGWTNSNSAVSDDGRFVVFQIGDALLPADTNGWFDIYRKDRIGGSLTLVSVTEAGGPANDHSMEARISADGSHVTFVSGATNIHPGDSNGLRDVFERDVVHGATIPISVNMNGDLSTGGGGAGSFLSEDGRLVGFVGGSNIVPGDTNNWADIFLREIAPPPSCLVRESLDMFHGDSDGPSVSAYVSADGHWVGFASFATDLVPGDTNGLEDVFLRDRTNKTTIRCSFDFGSGGEADGPSEAPSVSADGRFVAFASSATNLVFGDTNTAEDIFVFDRDDFSVARISVDSFGAQGNGSSYPPPWGGPSISPDGRYVAFCSQASNLIANDTNQTWDIFVHDRDFDHDGIFDEHVPGGIRTWRASVSSTGEEGRADSGQYGLWLSAYGRCVVFQSNAWNLIPNDVNGSDIFVHDNNNGSTVLVSYNDTGTQAFGFHSLPSISADLSLAADGRYVTWTSDSPVTAGDQNAVDDVFLRDRTLNQTTIVSVGTGGIQADWGSSRSMVDASGSRIVFDSMASTFVPGDGTIAWDIFVRNPQAGTTDLVSQPQGQGSSIWPTIDASGEIMAFSSESPALVGGDANNLSDVFVQDCDATTYVAFCAPGVDGIVACPCGNPQVPAGSTRGCNNFAGGGTGGASLTATGASSLSADTLGFQLAGGIGSNVTVLFQGTGNVTNTRSGAGVRCVGGTLKRLYRGQQSAGTATFPNNGVSVHDASAAKGYTIGAPSTLYYYCAYRNSAANGQPGCPGLTFGFNTTNALAVPWRP